jgi:hypothetical protein
MSSPPTWRDDGRHAGGGKADMPEVAESQSGHRSIIGAAMRDLPAVRNIVLHAHLLRGWVPTASPNV